MKKVDFKSIIGYFNFRGGSSGTGGSVCRDWAIAVICSSFVLAAVLAVDGYVIWRGLGAEKEVPAAESGKQKFSGISKTALDSAVEKIADKEKRFKNSSAAPKVADPSL